MPKLKNTGSILIEVLLALLILTSTTTYLLATRIDSRLLFQVTLDENAEHNGSLNSDRLALVTTRLTNVGMTSQYLVNRHYW